MFMFIYLYLIRRGILEGEKGYRFCMAHAIFSSFETMKIWEKRIQEEEDIGNYWYEEMKRDADMFEALRKIEQEIGE